MMLKKVSISIKLMYKTTKLFSSIKILLIIISALSVPFSIYIMQKMIESIEKIGSPSFSLYSVIMWITAFVGVNLWELVQQHISNLLQLTTIKKLKENLLPLLADKVSNIQYSSFEDSESKNIFHRMGASPHETILSIFDTTLSLFRDTISIIGIAFIFTKVSYWFFCIFLIILLPVLWCDYKSTVIVRRMHRDQTFAQRELGYYDGLLFNKYALHELKIMNSIEHIEEVWDQKAKLVLKEHVKSTMKSQFLMLSSTLLLFIFSASAMSMLLYNVFNRFISIGLFIALVNSIQSIYSISYNLSNSVTSLSRGLDQMEYFEQFFSISDAKKGTKDLPTEEYEIVFDHVNFSYPGSTNLVLADLTFSIKPGEKVCIVGRNGAGKSTIIKLLCGLYYPNSGTIKINGTNISEISTDQMKKIRSVVFQDYFKYYSTVRENVAYGNLSKLFDDQAIDDALERGQALEFIHSLSNKIDSKLGNIEDDGVDLSGGQWQKMAISRACICESDFIILDEPTASLDPVAESKMYHTFSKALKNSGYIFISHRLASAKMADRIIVIENGEIIEDGNHDFLMNQQGVYCEMFTKQSSWYTNDKEEEVAE